MSAAPKVGDRVVGNWGAMFATGRGVITGWCHARGWLVEWDDGSPYHTTWSKVHRHGYKSANGSSVGVTLAA